jgi:predicted ATP-dependent endonuclease of OLD family
MELNLRRQTTVIYASRDYDNSYYVWANAPLEDVVRLACDEVSVDVDDGKKILESESFDDAIAQGKSLAKELKDSGEALRAKAVAAFGPVLAKYRPLVIGGAGTQEQINALEALLPEFFYFSSYNILPGETDLNKLAAKVAADSRLTDSERTVVALLAHAGEAPSDFLDDDYASRKAELQASSVDLSRRVFDYWKQNPDLAVVFDTDNVVVEETPSGNQVAHRILKIELRDGRHGDVETNFSTRSTGFQWFFSFFAAFSEYQDSADSIIVLLDEPGTSLHGDAQRDFVRFIFQELGTSKQTIYTTHSQHMVDPTKYEKLRAVQDRATRDDPDQGVLVTRANLSSDRATILPIESALGYSIAQHLFIGSGQHLAVEGSSDFVYLQRVTEHQISVGKTGLDPRLAIIPVGGVDNMPAFVALLGRRLAVSALVDGAKTSNRMTRLKAAARDNGVDEASIVACADVDGLPTNADVEDLFDLDDYLKLYNWAFNTSVKKSDLAATAEPIIKKLTDLHGEYDHAIPAHALTERRVEFFSTVKTKTLENFQVLFNLLNATVKQ